jgi:hypothetical protein
MGAIYGAVLLAAVHRLGVDTRDLHNYLKRASLVQRSCPVLADPAREEPWVLNLAPVLADRGEACPERAARATRHVLVRRRGFRSRQSRGRGLG